MEKIIICDIDGCLINTSWIWKTISLLGIKDDATKWDFFGRNANALYNTIDKKLVRFLKAEIKHRSAKVMFLTARDSSIEQNTITFIENGTGLKYGKDFYISSRPGFDKLDPAESKKLRLIDIKSIFHIEFAIDDELKNCELFTRYDIPTFFWLIGSEPKIVGNFNLNLLAEYRAFVPLIDQVPKELHGGINLKDLSLDELTTLFEDIVTEINYRKEIGESAPEEVKAC